MGSDKNDANLMAEQFAKVAGAKPPDTRGKTDRRGRNLQKRRRQTVKKLTKRAIKLVKRQHGGRRLTQEEFAEVRQKIAPMLATIRGL